ncbi:MAG: sigma-70 family RNA polymerase sigma factor [Phycisphaerae bacterium]|nr:sigma-70 family RNA polymerase sigma factor [Phycisphaerae bacterium]
MDSQPTRPSLLVRLRDPADAAAWREFELRYGELIVRYGRARGLQQCDAEDVRQIVLTKLFRRLPTFEYARERGRFRDYLGTAVRNALHEWAACPDRSIRAVDPDVLARSEPLDRAEADRLWEKEWVDHHFRLALAAVAEQVELQSMAVFNQLLAGRSVEEVADAQEMTVEAIRKVRQRIRARLTEQIRQQVRDEDGGDG